MIGSDACYESLVVLIQLSLMYSSSDVAPIEVYPERELLHGIVYPEREKLYRIYKFEPERFEIQDV